jgi:hypothetical protein
MGDIADQLIDNEMFGGYDEFIPKRGDMVMVYDVMEGHGVELIYLTTIEGCIFPIRTVAADSVDLFKEGKPFYTSYWKHMKPISKPDPKAEALKKIDQAVTHHLAEVAKLQDEMKRLINEI